MKLEYLPITAFPFLLKSTIEQTSQHSVDFEQYLYLSNFVSEVNKIRCQFYSDFAKISLTDSKTTQKYIKHLYEDSLINWQSYHYSVFGLYILGAYDLATAANEKFFKLNNLNISNCLDHIIHNLNANSSVKELYKIISELFYQENAEIISSIRLKSNYSILAKIILSNAFSLNSIINLQEAELSESIMPYDLIGIRVITKSSNRLFFENITNRTNNLFKSKKCSLTDQNVFSPQWMLRKSFIGTWSNDGINIPFQIHLWDNKAKIYEHMCYGNYKLNKFFIPIIKNWKYYLDKGITEFEYINLATESF